MVRLGSKTPNKLTKFKSNVAIKQGDVKRKSIAQAVAASSANNIVTPKITTNVNAQDEADWQNTTRLASIDVK